MYSMFQQISHLFLKRKIYFDEKKTTKHHSCFVSFKIIVCKDDDVSALADYEFINENVEKFTIMYRVAMRNGIEVFQQSNCSHLLLLVKTVCVIDLLTSNKILQCT